MPVARLSAGVAEEGVAAGGPVARPPAAPAPFWTVILFAPTSGTPRASSRFLLESARKGKRVAIQDPLRTLLTPIPFMTGSTTPTLTSGTGGGGTTIPGDMV